LTLDRNFMFLVMDLPTSSKRKKKRRKRGTKIRAQADLTLLRPREPVPKERQGRM
jgi:hypothetical protein